MEIAKRAELIHRVTEASTAVAIVTEADKLGCHGEFSYELLIQFLITGSCNYWTVKETIEFVANKAREMGVESFEPIEDKNGYWHLGAMWLGSFSVDNAVERFNKEGAD